MSYTLTYSEAVSGWVSFYSYYPDWIIGMNNYLYTFKGGDLYQHNVNNLRNTFYEQWYNKFLIPPPPGPFVPSRIVSVINDASLDNKLFKTIELQGDSTWSATLETDIQNSGFIQANWFEKKEQAYFAFIRNNSNGQLPLRSVNGIGKTTGIGFGPGVAILNFSINPLVQIDPILSIGDLIYFTLPPLYDVPFLAGQVLNIIRNYPIGTNVTTIDTTIPGAVPILIQNPYIFYIKNSVAESHGVLGHYCVFDITNSSSSKIELYTVSSEVMKSFP